MPVLAENFSQSIELSDAGMTKKCDFAEVRRLLDSTCRLGLNEVRNFSGIAELSAQDLLGDKNFRGSCFTRIALSGDFSYARFDFATLNGVDFTKADISRAVFKGPYKEESRAPLKDVEWPRNIPEVNFHQVHFDGLANSFSERILQGCFFSKSDLTGVRFRDSELSDCTFSNCFLEQTDFSHSVVQGGFPGSTLSGVKFEGAGLAVNFAGATLKDVDFRGIDVSNCNFNGAILDNVTFDEDSPHNGLSVAPVREQVELKHAVAEAPSLPGEIALLLENKGLNLRNDDSEMVQESLTNAFDSLLLDDELLVLTMQAEGTVRHAHQISACRVDSDMIMVRFVDDERAINGSYIDFLLLLDTTKKEVEFISETQSATYYKPQDSCQLLGALLYDLDTILTCSRQIPKSRGHSVKSIDISSGKAVIFSAQDFVNQDENIAACVKALEAMRGIFGEGE